jgi:hypothetical protein
MKLRKQMIVVNDNLKHDICFSRMADGWMLENERDGLVSIHNTFAQAIIALEKAVGLNGSGYDWEVKLNPYGGD